MPKRRSERLFSLLLALWLLAGPILPALAADGEQFTISSAEDFAEFADLCALDSWSQGKTAVLTADLDLTGRGQRPIPTFGGVFLGQGHTISGLHITAAGSNQGLFRYLQPGGVVQDLIVKGTVLPEGSRSTVGGIVGDNAGTIQNCVFLGTVSGKSAVGGIAGRNEVSGEIINCSASGAVSGESATGGIAGRNLGLLLKCTNSAGINLTETDLSVNLMDLDAEAALMERVTSEDGDDLIFAGCSDTGGVAGYSSGVVQSCTNTARVGYPHVGYNTGGVVGRQSGYLAGCVNTGAIHGRKDVGGVVGQAEPYLVTGQGRDTLDQLRMELDTLDRLINRALDDVQSTGDNVSAHLTAMGDYTDTARDSSKQLLNRISDFTDENIDTVNTLTADITNALDKIGPALDDLSEVGGQLERLSGQLGDALEDLDGAVDIGDAAMAEIRAAVEHLRQSSTKLSTAARALERVVEDLLRGVTSGDSGAKEAALAQVRERTAALGMAFASGSAAVNSLLDALEGVGDLPIISDLLPGLDALQQALEDITAALERISKALPSREDLQQAAADLRQAFAALRDAGDSLDSALASLQRALRDAGGLSGKLGDALSGLQDVSNSASVIGRLLRNAFDTISSAVDSLTGDGPAEFTPLGEEARQASDNLFDALSGLSGEMEKLNSTVQSGNDTLTADLRAISRQFNVVFNLLLDTIDDARETREDGLDSVIQDTSEEDIAATREGKVTDCRNAGTVEGDRNVGGVVGSMAIEFDLDPEDDTADRFSFGSTYETKAVLQNCLNRGAITAKKDCVGGLVGRMDLGTILDCQNYGPVASTGGDYVGGVAGFADASVRSCFAKNSLSGKNYIGGIAGWTSRMQDCYAIATLQEGEEYLGAVAGSADNQSGLVNNRFVDTGTAGVDGVSYAGRAEPVPFEELKQLPDVPLEFTAFTLTLTAQEKTVAELPFFYGEDLSRLDLPQPPELEGCYGAWPEFDTSGLSSDLTLEAVYTPWVTLVASDRTVNKLSIALAEGRFTEEVELQVESGGIALPQGAREREEIRAEAWKISLLDSGLGPEDTVPLRLLNPAGGNAVVWQYEDGQWQQVEAVRNGQYFLLTMTGTQGVFYVQPQAGSLWLLLPAVGALLLVTALFIRVKSKKKAAKAVKAQAEEETAGSKG